MLIGGAAARNSAGQLKRQVLLSLSFKEDQAVPAFIFCSVSVLKDSSTSIHLRLDLEDRFGDAQIDDQTGSIDQGGDQRA